MQVNMLEAKNHLPTLIIAAERNEEVVIARNGIPVAKIIKYTAPKVAPPGAWKSRSPYAVDWNTAETNIEIEHLFSGIHNASAA